MVIVLGSGGHTAEMMSLLRDTDPRRYFHRTYIVSSGDVFSSNKAYEIEKSLQRKHKPSTKEPSKKEELDSLTGIWDVKIVPRARKIHQPLYTTPFSALWSMICCLYALYSCSRTSRIGKGQYPDIIVTNGPATAVMVIFAAAILKFLGVAPLEKMKTVYVESWARVRTLSLSGKILLKVGVCDVFLVQWESLAKEINGDGERKKVDWVGFLVA
jgi:beta-1,4-N-acetylglucosaminyltransferase